MYCKSCTRTSFLDGTVQSRADCEARPIIPSRSTYIKGWDMLLFRLDWPSQKVFFPIKESPALHEETYLLPEITGAGKIRTQQKSISWLFLPTEPQTTELSSCCMFHSYRTYTFRIDLLMFFWQNSRGFLFWCTCFPGSDTRFFCLGAVPALLTPPCFHPCFTLKMKHVQPPPSILLAFIAIREKSYSTVWSSIHLLWT